MFEFLEEEMDQRELQLFRKLVTLHFGSGAGGKSRGELVKDTQARIMKDVKQALSETDCAD